ncbi:hypothetical protein [Paenibacillus apii]|uniref:hypothetical protein n=1 Tax=Paenibacillus apii TaxID=1850370 RepID=UPI00143ABA24|nr:hypothetical protein [Paenibacillus apii]NJJ37801.1 hypothetical protein [Paenibacillus apii]
MSTSYKVLNTDADLFTASLAQARVAVFERCGELAGCIVDYGGPIQKWTPVSVKIADAYYLRSDFEFRVPI